MAFWAELGSNMWIAFKKIAASPFTDLSIWWFLAPVIVLWMILVVYFGEHKSEELGWNTALGNGISLTWINIESMRYLFSIKPDPFWTRFLIILGVMSYGFFIIYISFTHKFSSKATYLLASPNTVYYLAGVTILWGHGNLQIDFYVLLDLILIFFVFVWGIYGLFRKYLPDRGSSSDNII